MFPPVKWKEVKNADARNSTFTIEIEPSEPFSVLAQECAEWQHKAILWIPVSIISSILLGLGGWHVAGWFIAVIGAALGFLGGAVLGHNLRSGTREIEYWGRAVDLVAGGDLDKLAKELSGYGQFRNRVSVEEIKEEILKRKPKAEEWLEENLEELKEIYSKRPVQN